MKKNKAARGSALMIALVIAIITAGIGGAFLSQALIHSNEQRWSIEGDEAFGMCDAGMERARHALGIYRFTKNWTWTEICQYCDSSPAAIGSKPVYATANPPPDFYAQWRMAMKNQLKKDAAAVFTSTTFRNYAGASLTTDSVGKATAVSTDNDDPTNLLPASHTAWNVAEAPDATTGKAKVLFGHTIPFGRGTIHIHIAPPLMSDGSLMPVATDPDNIVVTVTATLQSGIQRQVEAIISKPVVKVSIPGLAAIVSNDDVSLTGSIKIDGRDHDYSGNNVLPSSDPARKDVYGIISNSVMSAVTNGSVGGNGNAPPSPKGAAANSVKDLYPFSGGFPSNPDQAMALADGSKLPNGTLKQAAMDAGTYFATEAAYNTYMQSKGKLPDGGIVYLEYTPSNGQFDMGSGNQKSSILVIHNDTNSGIVQEVHGNFTGLILADGFVRNNGTSHIVGMVQLFSPTASTAGNVFGNGNAEIDFSSAALADLPGLGATNTPAKLVSYRRVQ